MWGRNQRPKMGKWHEKEMFCCLNQKSANYNPWAKSGQLHAFVNKILLEHGHVHLYVVYECFHATWAELNSFDGIVWPAKQAIFTSFTAEQGLG